MTGDLEVSESVDGEFFADLTSGDFKGDGVLCGDGFGFDGDLNVVADVGGGTGGGLNSTGFFKLC